MKRTVGCMWIILIAVIFSSLNVMNEDDAPVTSPIAFSDRFRKRYACIYQFLQDSIASNHSLCAQDVFNIFSGNGKNRLVFDVRKLPPGISGLTDGARLTRNGVFSTTVYLSERVLKNWSKEYLVAVVLHEGVHVYTHWCMLSFSQKSNGVDTSFLKAKFPVNWQWLTQGPDSMNQQKLHTLMSENYIPAMKRCIYAFTNPALRESLRDSIATALAWGGLDEAPKWSRQRLDTCYILAVDGWARNMRVDTGQSFFYGHCDTVRHGFQDSLKLRFPCNR